MPESKSPWFTPVDTGALPLTEPHPAPIFDTGPHPAPLDVWAFAATDTLEKDAQDKSEAEVVESGLLPVPAPPIAVPGQYLYLKWWKFVLVTLGVWAPAAAIGAGLYYWWFHAFDKTWTEFAVLIYVIVCVVAALLVSMVERRPTLAASAIGLMTAPFAAGAAAAALYGMVVFRWITL